MEKEKFTTDGPKTFPICTGQAKYQRTSHALSWIKSVIGDDYCSESNWSLTDCIWQDDFGRKLDQIHFIELVEPR